MTLTESSSPTRHRPLQRVGLVPFVAVLYAYCAGGPFGFEAMVSTAGPGMALLFILTVPLLLSVPMALATAEMASAIPVEGGFYRWSRTAFGDFWGFQCGWWNWTGTFLMSGAYGVMLADYIGQLAPIQSKWGHWLIAFAFLATVAYLNIRGIRLVGNLTFALLLLALISVAIFTVRGVSHARFNPFHPLIPTNSSWHQVFGVGLALAFVDLFRVRTAFHGDRGNRGTGAHLSPRAGHRCALGYDHVLPACRFSSKRVGKLANLANRLHGGSGAANWRAVAAMDYVRGCRCLHVRATWKHDSFRHSSALYHVAGWLFSSRFGQAQPPFWHTRPRHSSVGRSLRDARMVQPHATHRRVCLVARSCFSADLTFRVATAQERAGPKPPISHPRRKDRPSCGRSNSDHALWLGAY